MTEPVTGSTTGSTSDGSAAPRTPWWARFTVRTRIAVTVAVLCALALGAAGILVFLLETNRIDNRVNDRIDQEAAELAVFHRTAVDPDTGRKVVTADRLLELYLARNVTEDSEMLVRYTGAEAKARSPHDDGEAVLADRSFTAAVAPMLAGGGTRDLTLPGLGEVWVTALPVVDGSADGALVVVSFLDEEREELASTMRTYALVASLSLVLLAVVAAAYSGRLLAPLRVLRETAQDITATDLSRRIPVTGQDDIAALTRTVNEMLARLEAGFGAQREFLDDAGHELKTPLTVLRGHLELLAPGNAAEVAETRDLLLDEVDRMARLVEDLILLAKSERPDFLAPAEVDLPALLDAVTAKASGLGARQWRVEPTPEIAVELDEQRITQALLQLAANAVKHTREDTPVVLGARVAGDELQLWVRDHGPGVRPSERTRIFERFGRSTLAPGDDGFGLGLSIVRAIAEAHGGRAFVEDARPGARFVIAVPLVRAYEQADDQTRADEPTQVITRGVGWPAS